MYHFHVEAYKNLYVISYLFSSLGQSKGGSMCCKGVTMLSHHMHNSCPGESSRYAIDLVWVRNISSFLFGFFFSIVLNHHDFGIICYHSKT